MSFTKPNLFQFLTVILILIIDFISCYSIFHHFFDSNAPIWEHQYRYQPIDYIGIDNSPNKLIHLVQKKPSSSLLSQSSLQPLLFSSDFKHSKESKMSKKYFGLPRVISHANANYKNNLFFEKTQAFGQKPLSFRVNKGLRELIGRYQEMQTTFYEKPLYKKLIMKIFLRFVMNHVQ